MSQLNRLLSPLETVINRALAKSPATALGLRALANTCVLLDTPIVQVKLHTDGTKLHLFNNSLQRPDAKLTATPITLARLLVTETETELLESREITVGGNRDILSSWLTLFRELDLDWEALIADHLGDIPAHLVGQTVRSGSRWSRNFNNALLGNIEEYLLEEARLLPTRSEQKYQRQQIRDLASEVEALEERTRRLLEPLPKRVSEEGNS